MYNIVWQHDVCKCALAATPYDVHVVTWISVNVVIINPIYIHVCTYCQISKE